MKPGEIPGNNGKERSTDLCIPEGAEEGKGELKKKRIRKEKTPPKNVEAHIAQQPPAQFACP
jgi:hypothetical protein